MHHYVLHSPLDHFNGCWLRGAVRKMHTYGVLSQSTITRCSSEAAVAFSSNRTSGCGALSKFMSSQTIMRSTVPARHVGTRPSTFACDSPFCVSGALTPGRPRTRPNLTQRTKASSCGDTDSSSVRSSAKLVRRSSAGTDSLFYSGLVHSLKRFSVRRATVDQLIKNMKATWKSVSKLMQSSDFSHTESRAPSPGAHTGVGARQSG